MSSMTLHRFRRPLAVILLLVAAVAIWWHRAERLPRASAVIAVITPVERPSQPANVPLVDDAAAGDAVDAPPVAATVPAVADPSASELPPHWRLGGSASEAYALSLDRSTVWNGSGSAMLASITPDASPYSFGALVQTVSAAPFRKKRIELSAFVKTDEALAGAALWIRADDASSTVVAFDNMNVRMIRRATPWTRRAIVIDIPAEAEVISFGGLLNGRGRLWIDDIQITEADAAATPTSRPMPRLSVARPSSATESSVSAEPLNLDFETVP